MSSGMDSPDSALQHRMLHETTAPDFLDSSLEWRRIFSEVWGTFLLVVVAAGASIVATKSNGAVTLGMAVVAPGLMVMVIIYFMGTVSGAHLNPAVTPRAITLTVVRISSTKSVGCDEFPSY